METLRDLEQRVQHLERLISAGQSGQAEDSARGTVGHGLLERYQALHTQLAQFEEDEVREVRMFRRKRLFPVAHMDISSLLQARMG